MYSIKTIFEGESSPEVVWDFERFCKSEYMKFSHKPLQDFQGFSECYNLALPLTEIIQKFKKQKETH